MDIKCFHNPDEENGYLSNWFLSDFSIEGIKYTSMEQYMMYKKAVCFGNYEVARHILHTDEVARIKQYGRSVSGYNDNIWSGIRQIIVYDGLMEKFSQNEKLKKRLLDTDDAILAECAVRDCIWGIGLSMKDDRRFDISQWKGQNLLGYTLMMVRNRLR